ncbi:MAG: NUMOD4 domain-containing protein [Telluria sp.]
MEVWRDVVGYEGRYQVSDQGRVKSLPNARRKSELILKQSPHVKSGHMIVRLTDSYGGRWRQGNYYVHALVLTAFLCFAPTGEEGCHDDGNPANNALKNLRWDTRASNQADRTKHGTDNAGERNGQATLTEQNVRSIKTRLATGAKVGVLAKEFGVVHGAISLIKQGKRWRHV